MGNDDNSIDVITKSQSGVKKLAYLYYSSKCIIKNKLDAI